MIAVRLDSSVSCEAKKHEEANGFGVEDGFLFIFKGNERLAAYPAHLVISVTKEKSCCKH